MPWRSLYEGGKCPSAQYYKMSGEEWDDREDMKTYVYGQVF